MTAEFSGVPTININLLREEMFPFFAIMLVKEPAYKISGRFIIFNKCIVRNLFGVNNMNVFKFPDDRCLDLYVSRECSKDKNMGTVDRICLNFHHNNTMESANLINTRDTDYLYWRDFTKSSELYNIEHYNMFASMLNEYFDVTLSKWISETSIDLFDVDIKIHLKCDYTEVE